jgi:hypothetical protein
MRTTLQLEEVTPGQSPLCVWSGTAEEFLSRNHGVLSAEEVATIGALEVGASFESGGGGEPRWRLTRMS